MDDISGLDNIYKLYENSPIKKWIKLIPIHKTILLDKYNRKEYFIPIADIVLDNEVFTDGQKQGIKKRKHLFNLYPKFLMNSFVKKQNGYTYLL